MFFIGGISSGEKKLDYAQSSICSRCGAFGRMEVYMTYMCFSLFFIPIFKWNIKYYVKTTCCNSIYSIDNELGSKVKKVENISITEDDLHVLINESSSDINKCYSCGYKYEDDFQYCPKCGSKL